MGLFLRSDQTLSVAEAGEGSDSHGEDDSRRVGEPNGVEGSGCPSQSTGDGEVGCGLEDLAEYLWWEVYDGHCDHRSFSGSRYQRWSWGYESVIAGLHLVTDANCISVRHPKRKPLVPLGQSLTSQYSWAQLRERMQLETEETDGEAVKSQ